MNNNKHNQLIKKAFDSIELATLNGQIVCLECLEDFFVKSPDIKCLPMRVNNHEFNDGDPTVFNLRCYDLEIEWRNNPPENEKQVLKDLEDLLESINNDPIVEALFGEEYESFKLNRQYIQNKIKNAKKELAKLESETDLENN